MGDRYLIWGSCVSRDTSEFFGPERSLTRYIARQSMISAGSQATPKEPLPVLESAFQQRMNAGDAEGDALNVLTQHAAEVDWLLLDLCDERLGVIEVAPGEYLTRSVERMLAGADESLRRDHRQIDFGSREHLRLWTAAWQRVQNRLAELDLLRCAIVLAPDWATLTASGVQTPTSFGLPASRANQLYQGYYRVLERSGVTMVGRELAVRADSDHRWGLAPFHYDEPTYLALVELINEAVDKLGCHPK